MTLGARLGVLLLVAVAAVVGSIPALQGDFLADDFGCIRVWGPKPVRELLRFGDISDGIWGGQADEPRPIDALVTHLAWHLFKTEPWGYLAVNLALHASCAVLVAVLAQLALPLGTPLRALAAGLVFALHPVHAEAIAWITGKVDSLACVFYLSALALFLAWRKGQSRLAYWASVVVFALGLLAKETLLTLPLVIVAWDAAFCSDTRRRLRLVARGWLAYLPFLAVTLAYLCGRKLAFGSFARDRRIGLQLANVFLKWQAFSFRQLFPEQGWVATASIAAAGLALCLLLIRDLRAGSTAGETSRAVGRAAFFALAFYAITQAPLLMTYLSARHLYLPSAGLAVGFGFLAFPNGRRPLVRLAASVVICAFLALRLHASEERWVSAGLDSRLARSQFASLVRNLPPQATVVLAGRPGTDRDILVWKAALPFAFEPPFVPRSLLASIRLIEQPDLYCCPRQQWWRARSPAIEALLFGPPEETVSLHLLEWESGPRQMRLSERRLPRRALQECASSPAGGGAGQLPVSSDRRGLVAALAQCVRDPSSPARSRARRP